MDRALEKQLVMAWVRGCEEIEAMRRRELAAMTDEQACEAALDLLTIPLPPDLPPRLESGLVEQQRWFRRLHSKS